MFTPKIAKPQTKTAETPAGKLTPQRSGLLGHRLGHDSARQALLLQRTIGNQAILRLRAQQRSRPVGSVPDNDHEQEVTESMIARAAPRGVSWDFSKIPVFAPDRANRPQGRSSLSPRPQLLPSIIQPKLAIGDVNDPLEHEADRVADQVMRMPNPDPSITGAPPQISRKCAACEEEAKTLSGQTVAPPIVEQALANGGGSLPDGLRAEMEHRFAHDFSNVRVHTHSRAAESAAAVGARAYTVGRDVAFAAGEYAPYTGAGRRLIAHELAHVVQQQGARLSSARAGIMVGASNDPLEREADAAAQRAKNEDAAPGIASASLSAGASRVARPPVLQRDDGPGEKKEETQLPRVPYRDKPADEKQSQEDESEKGPALVPASAARPTCDPKGLKRKDYLAQPNTSTDDFGLTRFSGTVSMALPTRKVRGGVALEPLQVALPPITSVFTTADTFIEGTVVFVSQGGAECPSGKVPMQWRIWPTGEPKIREGELEHCEDLQYAYDVTFGWYSQVVDRLIAKGQTFPNEAAAYKHLKKLTGADHTNWPSIFSCLIKKTELRDGKKFSNGWHTPQVKSQPPRLDDSCKFSRVYITGAANFPELGKHPTPSVITGCGESPDAVKAVAAKAAAAKASAGSEGQQEGKPGEPPPKTPEPPPKSTEPER